MDNDDTLQIDFPFEYFVFFLMMVTMGCGYGLPLPLTTSCEIHLKSAYCAIYASIGDFQIHSRPGLLVLNNSELLDE